ncbi:choline/ethanolamine kinase protein, putative [Cryptosporidium muris RN66]|uniref:Choline/ethanolamine kinase protein, putative n=1 Tax=Cryptosporidium muris (strain RN66) TaxID=441375 RepID=B6AGE1_CRYMR|nr:choline/ethanolamine kinase protein, putative [Cryptosporidium muris RN66]EEA07282.1 choline/ethanolamine kinase protein, putative [Cryptosporidium muris RN66]|eukprot:XP_002141631.1 choline/ethanolamine kinase protein [Cryptosporidium muris RN66]
MPFELTPFNDKNDLAEYVRAFSSLTDPTTIRYLCRTHVPGWSNIPEKFICVSQIVAGLTNQLFEVTVTLESVSSKLKHSRVLFRIYGTYVGRLYDTKVEVEAFKYLGKVGIAPALIADFTGGRIEEFIDGDPLTAKQLKITSVCTDIASILGRLHTLNTSRKDFPSFFDKEPIAFKRLKLWRSEVVTQLSHLDSDLLTNIWTYFDKTFLEEMLNEANSIEILILGASQSPTICSKLADISLVYNAVFAHNDIQENNLLQVSTGLKMIDFEYSNVNYAAADIANFFCEFMYDYCHDKPPYFIEMRDSYPSKSLRKVFVAVYLSKIKQEEILPDDDIVNTAVDIIETFTLLSHLSWGFWSIARISGHHTNSLAFDFIQYSKVRFLHYLDKKKQLVQQGILPLKWDIYS